MSEMTPSNRLFGRTCLHCDLFRPVNGVVDRMVCRCGAPKLDYRQANHWIEGGLHLNYDAKYDLEETIVREF